VRPKHFKDSLRLFVGPLRGGGGLRRAAGVVTASSTRTSCGLWHGWGTRALLRYRFQKRGHQRNSRHVKKRETGFLDDLHCGLATGRAADSELSEVL